MVQYVLLQTFEVGSDKNMFKKRSQVVGENLRTMKIFWGVTLFKKRRMEQKRVKKRGSQKSMIRRNNQKLYTVYLILYLFFLISSSLTSNVQPNL